MHRGDKILRLIALIYDAAENQELWPVFLHELSTALHGNLSAIVTHDKASPGGRVLAIHGGDPEAQVQYEAKHSGTNIYAKRAATSESYLAWLHMAGCFAAMTRYFGVTTTMSSFVPTTGSTLLAGPLLWMKM